MTPHLNTGHPLPEGTTVKYSPAGKTRGARDGTIVDVKDGRLGAHVLYVVQDDMDGHDVTVPESGVLEAYR